MVCEFRLKTVIEPQLPNPGPSADPEDVVLHIDHERLVRP